MPAATHTPLTNGSWGFYGVRHDVDIYNVIRTEIQFKATTMETIFLTNELSAIAMLGIPTAIYFVIAYKKHNEPIAQLSESIANYNLFNSLYSIFLSMALVTLLVNFNNVQDDTRREAESIISAARLMVGLSDAASLQNSLAAYTKSVIDYDIPALRNGMMSAEASAAFDNLWEQTHNINTTTRNDESIYRMVLGEISDITKCRLTRRIKCKENLHPLIFSLIVIGYYIMLIKTYITRVENKKAQLATEISMFAMIMFVVIVIIDLNTPYSGIVNIDTSAFNFAYERVKFINSIR